MLGDDHLAREHDEVRDGRHRADERHRDHALAHRGPGQQRSRERDRHHRGQQRRSDERGEVRELAGVHPDDRAGQQRPDGPGERDGGGEGDRPPDHHGSNRYPTPQTVTR